MKIIEIATGKEVEESEVEQEQLYIQNGKVYEQWYYTDDDLYVMKNVSDKYSIVSDVRSREEIEEIKNKYERLEGLLSPEGQEKLDTLRWVLKESE